MTNSFKQELQALLRSDEMKEKIATAKTRRYQCDRIDELVAIVKGIITQTSLCLCDEKLSSFDGRRFREVKSADIENIINNTLCDLDVPATLSAKVPPLALKILTDKKMWSQPHLVTFNNCVYDINTSKTHRFSPEIASSYSVGYDYTPKSISPLWGQFLDVILPDKDKQAVLQEFVGMVYIDRTKISIEKCLILVGNGANGKSVIYNVLKALVGEQYVSTFRPSQLATDIGVYGTIGKKLNCCSEVQTSDTMTGALKPLISHEPVEGKGLYKEHVQVRCPPIIFILNEFPSMPDSSFGFWRRMLIIDFDVTIPKLQQDKTLASRIIKEELSGIFNWAMEGRNRLLANHGEFTHCAAIESKVAETETLSNPILSYITEQGYTSFPTHQGQQPLMIRASDLIDNFENVSETQLGREMRRMSFVKVKKGVIMYQVYKNDKQLN